MVYRGVALLLLLSTPIHAQHLLFGEAILEGKTTQVRLEVDSLLTSMIYAPYGITPVPFTNILQKKGQISFDWTRENVAYRCTMMHATGSYKGTCVTGGDEPIGLIIRDFTEEDARLQGNFLQAGQTDLQILDRALQLLNDGRNWDRVDDRVCDRSSYPYEWSLFCALHQASIDVDSEYRHLRPAIKAARQAIEEASPGREYAHMLQDFNNEAKNFDAIASVLKSAKTTVRKNMHDRK